MIKHEDVTIIIPHLGETDEQKTALIDCLISLEETFTGKIIIATNGSNWNRVQKFEDLVLPRGQITRVHVSEQGQCKAVNAAVATVTTPYIFVTNDDMIYPPHWFEDLVGRALKVWCISPKLVEPRDGAPTFEVYFCGGAGGDFDKQKFFEYVNTKKNTVDPNESLYENGFNLPFLMDKGLWDTIGGYDINYDPWGSNSDSDLLYKIRLAGIQPKQSQNCRVYHFSQTSGTFEPRNSDYWAKNWDYFIEKWGFKRTDDGIWTADFEMPEAMDHSVSPSWDDNDPMRKPRIFTPEWEGKY